MILRAPAGGPRASPPRRATSRAPTRSAWTSSTRARGGGGSAGRLAGAADPEMKNIITHVTTWTPPPTTVPRTPPAAVPAGRSMTAASSPQPLADTLAPYRLKTLTRTSTCPRRTSQFEGSLRCLGRAPPPPSAGLSTLLSARPLRLPTPLQFGGAPRRLGRAAPGLWPPAAPREASTARSPTTLSASRSASARSAIPRARQRVTESKLFVAALPLGTVAPPARPRPTPPRPPGPPPCRGRPALATTQSTQKVVI